MLNTYHNKVNKALTEKTGHIWFTNGDGQHFDWEMYFRDLVQELDMIWKGDYKWMFVTTLTEAEDRADALFLKTNKIGKPIPTMVKAYNGFGYIDVEDMVDLHE